MTALLTGPGRRLRPSSFVLHCVPVGATDCSAVEASVRCPRLRCIAWRWARRIAARLRWVCGVLVCAALRGGGRDGLQRG
jgi:hypothetical protein